MEQTKAQDHMGATVLKNSRHDERVSLTGLYLVKCFDKDGNLKWEDTIHNQVMTTGVNALLDITLSTTTGYVVAGPYMGLIPTTGFTAFATNDTMSSHSGWLEAGTAASPPTYTAPRPTLVFNAASSRSKGATAASFAITTAGTAHGAFVVFYTGATNTQGDTGGCLLSAGAFTGGDKIVANSDTLQVTYSLAMT